LHLRNKGIKWPWLNSCWRGSSRTSLGGNRKIKHKGVRNTWNGGSGLSTGGCSACAARLLGCLRTTRSGTVLCPSTLFSEEFISGNRCLALRTTPPLSAGGGGCGGCSFDWELKRNFFRRTTLQGHEFVEVVLAEEEVVVDGEVASSELSELKLLFVTDVVEELDSGKLQRCS